MPMPAPRPLAFALLTLLSAMNASAILPASPSDAGLESPRAENPAVSAAPAVDFDSLLFMFSSALQSEPAIDAGADSAEVESEPAGDVDPEKLSLQLVLTHAVVALYDPSRQVVAVGQDFGGEFSEALDLSPVYANERATAEALPFEGRLPEAPEEVLTDPDLIDTSNDAAVFSLEAVAPAATAETPSAQEAARNILPFRPAERTGAGLTLENDAPKDGAVNYVFPSKPAPAETSEKISHESNRTAAPEAAAPRAYGLQNKNHGQDPSSDFESRDRESTSTRGPINLSRDAEKFVLPGSSPESRLAARVEAASSPGDESGLFTARKDVSSDGDSNVLWLAQGSSLRGLESERAAAPQTANLWSSTIERLAAEISTHVRHNRHEVTMRLEPPELGNLRIELSLDGDRLQARVTAEVADAGSLIQTHLPELRQALQAHKLDLVNVQVDLGGWAGLGAGLTHDSRQQTQERVAPAAPAMSLGGDGEAKEVAKTPPVTDGAVSVWA